MADLELCNFIVLQHVLELVGAEGPDAIGILQRVLCDDLSVQLIELNEVGVAQAEVFEQFDALMRLIAQ